MTMQSEEIEHTNNFNRVEEVAATIRKHLYETMYEIRSSHLIADATFHALASFMLEMNSGDYFLRLINKSSSPRPEELE
jgi:hypothetical protein